MHVAYNCKHRCEAYKPKDPPKPVDAFSIVVGITGVVSNDTYDLVVIKHIILLNEPSNDAGQGHTFEKGEPIHSIMSEAHELT